MLSDEWDLDRTADDYYNRYHCKTQCLSYICCIAWIIRYLLPIVNGIVCIVMGFHDHHFGVLNMFAILVLTFDLLLLAKQLRNEWINQHLNENRYICLSFWAYASKLIFCIWYFYYDHRSDVDQKQRLLVEIIGGCSIGCQILIDICAFIIVNNYLYSDLHPYVPFVYEHRHHHTRISQHIVIPRIFS